MALGVCLDGSDTFSAVQLHAHRNQFRCLPELAFDYGRKWQKMFQRWFIIAQQLSHQ